MSFVDHRLKDSFLYVLLNLSSLLDCTVITSVSLSLYNSSHFSIDILAVPTRKSLLLQLGFLFLSHFFLAIFHHFLFLSF